MPKIVVTGSLNVDFVCRVAVLPRPGETVLAARYETVPGGKGANQAVAAGRLGGNVAMAGCVGQDAFGEQLRDSLRQAGVNIDHVETVDGPTGIAMIRVDSLGQNSIVVAPGANDWFRADPVVYQGTQFALFQLENPIQEVIAAMKMAREAGAQVILDPAPAQPLPPEALALVDILTPNESEAELLGESVTHARAVVYKLGAAGCRFADRNGSTDVPGFRVEAVDTTAAGDCFNGALAVALGEGQSILRALRFANAAAAIAVSRPGAQPSLPSRAEVDKILTSS